MIPKILHQVFLGFDTPNISDIPIYSKCQEQTKKCLNKCLKWKYKLWTDQQCENLVEIFYPEFIQLWNDFTQPIMKADFIRYLILHKSNVKTSVFYGFGCRTTKIKRNTSKNI